MRMCLNFKCNYCGDLEITNNVITIFYVILYVFSLLSKITIQGIPPNTNRKGISHNIAKKKFNKLTLANNVHPTLECFSSLNRVFTAPLSICSHMEFVNNKVLWHLKVLQVF